MARSAQDLMNMIQENGIQMVDFKIVDINGQFRHVTIPASNFTEETIKDGSYVIQRPFVLVTKEDTKLSETAQKFYDYALSEEARETITSAGVVPAN